MSADDPRSPDNRDYELEKANLIWNEYKYRHEHIWKLLFQVTTAVIAVSIVPYILKEDMVEKLGVIIILLPFIGLALAVFSTRRLWEECFILDQIRPKHRAFHKSDFNIDYDKQIKKGHNKNDNIHDKNEINFTDDVMTYLIYLIALAVLNFIIIVLEMLIFS